MKITLIQPKAGRYNPAYIHEPLNLGYLAGYARTAGFHDLRIIVSAFRESDDEIVDEAARGDLVGFTATSPMMRHALIVAGRIKERNPKAVIVFGGAHPSIAAEETLSHAPVDYVVRGEGEQTFSELAEAIRDGANPSIVKGLSFRESGGHAVHNPDRNLFKDLDQLPFPDRDLFDQERFLALGYQKYGDRGAWILSSRGCPFSCTYCASHRIWTRKWRFRSAENILAEINWLKRRYTIDRINFADDTFTISRKRVREFCERMISERQGLAWACNARVDTVDEPLFRLMKEAGCQEVWMGVESGSPDILKEIRKDVSRSQIVEGFRAAKAAGLLTRGYFMIGSRSESRETIGRTEALIDLIQPDRLAFSVLTPYPGCEEHDHWIQLDGHSGIDWSEVDLLETESVLVSSKYLSRDEIKSEHKRLQRKYAHLWRT